MKELRFPVYSCSAQETGLWASDAALWGHGYTHSRLSDLPGCGYLALNRLVEEAGEEADADPGAKPAAALPGVRAVREG